jgi:hypothetical protein
MRLIVFAVTSTLMASAHAGGSFWEPPVNLNRPGILEQLKLERPKHFAAISEVLRIVERVPCETREVETLKVRYDITQWACNFTLMTSDPPKRRLSFQLEETRYVAVVTLKGTEGRVVPARNAD